MKKRILTDIEGTTSSISFVRDVLFPYAHRALPEALRLEHLADAMSAGIVLGARVPIVLTSRSDSAETRAASTAVAAVMVCHKAAKAP